MDKYVIKTNQAKGDGKPCYFFAYCGKLCQTPLGCDELDSAKKFTHLGEACVNLHHIEHQKEKAFGLDFHIVSVYRTVNTWKEREIVDLDSDIYRL